MRQVSLRFGSEHFQIQTSKLPCAPLSFILPPRSRGWSSAAGDQSQQRKCGSYIKMEDYTSCPASLIKRLEKVLLRKLKKMNLLSFSLFYIPLVLRFINRCEKTWTENVVLDRNVWCLRQHWRLPLLPGPNHSDLCTTAVLRLCLCMCASVCQANGFTGDGVGYLLPCVIECNDYRCCVMRF